MTKTKQENEEAELERPKRNRKKRDREKEGQKRREQETETGEVRVLGAAAPLHGAPGPGSLCFSSFTLLSLSRIRDQGGRGSLFVSARHPRNLTRWTSRAPHPAANHPAFLPCVPQFDRLERRGLTFLDSGGPWSLQGWSPWGPNPTTPMGTGLRFLAASQPPPLRSPPLLCLKQ